MKKSTDELRAELAALDAMSDSEINYEDIPPADARPERLRGGTVGRHYRPLSVEPTLQLDQDVLERFISTGEDYQTRINAVLRDSTDFWEPLLEDLEASLKAHEFEHAARSVSAMVKLRPETGAYIRGRVLVIIFDTLLKPSVIDCTRLTTAIADKPVWWLTLEQSVAEPSLFAPTVKQAIETVQKIAGAAQGQP